MEKLTQSILANAEAEAEKLVKQAKLERERRLRSVKKEAKTRVKEVKQEAKKEGKQRAETKATRMMREARTGEMVQEKQTFEALKSAVEKQLRKNPRKLFRAVVKAGRKEFKRPKVEAGKEFMPALKKMRVKAKAVDGLDGIRIGKDDVWLSAEIPEVVDQYFEDNYPQLMEQFFGD